MLPELREDQELLEAATAARFGVSPVLGLRPEPGRETAVLEKLKEAVKRATAREAARWGAPNGIIFTAIILACYNSFTLHSVLLQDLGSLHAE